MSKSVRLYVPCGRAQDGDLLVEIVSDDLRHFQIEGHASRDPENGFSITFRCLPNDCGSECELQQSADISSRDDRIDDLNGRVVRVDLNNDLTGLLVGQNSYSNFQSSLGNGNQTGYAGRVNRKSDDDA